MQVRCQQQRELVCCRHPLQSVRSKNRQQTRTAQDQHIAHYCVLVITALELNACHLPLRACSKAGSPCDSSKSGWDEHRGGKGAATLAKHRQKSLQHAMQTDLPLRPAAVGWQRSSSQARHLVHSLAGPMLVKPGCHVWMQVTGAILQPISGSANPMMNLSLCAAVNPCDQLTGTDMSHNQATWMRCKQLSHSAASFGLM